VKIGKHSLHHQIFVLLLLLGGVTQGQAATRFFDRIEVKTGARENTITVFFNIPVRYVSHVMNAERSEAGIQLQIIQTRDFDLGDLVQTDQLSWDPSAEVPLNKVEFQGQAVGTSTLVVSFASPVEGFRIRQGRDFYRMDFIIKRPKEFVEVPLKKAPSIDLNVPETRPPRTFKSLPLVIYVINLTSEQQPIDLNKIAPIPIAGDKSLYTTKADVKGHSWYRLRLGFFRTMEDAKRQLKGIKNFYPNAWIDRADIEERRQALALAGGQQPLPQPGPAKTKPSRPARQAPALVANDRLTKMMKLTRRTMTAGEYAKAIRMLEAILEEPENAYTKEARELLGLARERNGQIAHAKAEYRAYLNRYPEGEDAERVKQRLLGLETATLKPHEPLRAEPGKPEKPKVEWETFGSLAQNYRRDSVDSEFVDSADSVTRSEIETFVDLNSRRLGEDYDLRMKLTTSYISDLLSDGEGDDSTLTDAYVDLEHRASRANLRLGRQRLRSSGVLNRFDGLVLGYELTPDVRVRAAAGLPVERSGDVFLNKHKTFAGLSGDLLNIFDNWDLSLFLIEQRVDGLVDRRAVGGEVRYFDQHRSLFSLLDYDIFYGSLNTFLLQGNWTLGDQTRLFMNLDYRNSPVLMTSNALIGQIDPVTQQAIGSIDELKRTHTEEQIDALAEDRTAQTSTLSLGASRPLYPTLQLSGDITVTHTSSTPASGGVEATPSTGNEYFYNFQVIKNDLLKKGDIGIFSLRYSDASTSNTIRLSASSRYPVTNFFRINPRFSVSYRSNNNDDGTRWEVSPFIQMDYRYRKSLTLEMETGLDWFQEDDGTTVTNFTDFFFLAGYRWDF